MWRRLTQRNEQEDERHAVEYSVRNDGSPEVALADDECNAKDRPHDPRRHRATGPLIRMSESEKRRRGSDSDSPSARPTSAPRGEARNEKPTEYDLLTKGSRRQGDGEPLGQLEGMVSHGQKR